MSSTENKGPTIVAVICTVTSLSTLFCAARLYTRGRILGHLQLDDWLIFLSTIFGWLSVIFGILAVDSGQGRHFDTLSLDEKSGAIFWTMVGFCPGVMSFGVPKLAVVSLLTRLLMPSRRHLIFLWCLAGLTMLSLFVCIGLLFGQCTPSRSQWDFSVTSKTCWSPWILVHFAMFAGVLSATTDLYLAVYPGFVLCKLQMKLKKKISLIVALGIGSVATVVSIYKTTRLPSLASSDFSYDTSDLLMWTCIEGSTIIIASCIPILQPLADRILGSSFFGSSDDHGHYKNYGTSRTNGGGGGVGTSGIELTATARHKPRDPNGLTFLDKGGSEETILRLAQEQNKPDKPHAGDYTELPDNSIVRTDVVTVSYSKPADGVKGIKGWNRGF